MDTDHSKAAAAIFSELARDYQDKFMDISLYQDSFDLFCENITTQPHASILEIGCGPGNITRYILEKRPDFKLLGIDLAENMIELAKINNPSAGFEVMDCRAISKISQQFDAVMCGFCLPYLSKEEAIKLISDCSVLLKNKGMLYISTMEDYNSKSGFKTGSSGKQMYMNYHEADYLREALEENNFSIIDMRRQDYPNDGAETKDLILIARKHNHEKI